MNLVNNKQWHLVQVVLDRSDESWVCAVWPTGGFTVLHYAANNPVKEPSGLNVERFYQMLCQRVHGVNTVHYM